VIGGATLGIDLLDSLRGISHLLWIPEFRQVRSHGPWQAPVSVSLSDSNDFYGAFGMARDGFRDAAQ